MLYLLVTFIVLIIAVIVAVTFWPVVLLLGAIAAWFVVSYFVMLVCLGHNLSPAISILIGAVVLFTPFLYLVNRRPSNF